MGLWTTQARCPQAPQAQRQQQKRTIDVLQNADIFTRYGQPRCGGRDVRVSPLGQIKLVRVCASDYSIAPPDYSAQATSLW